MTKVQFQQTEDQFQETLIEYAKLRGWKVYFTWHSIHSPSGFPDLILLHEEKRIIMAVECKVGKNKPTQAQEEWLSAFRKTIGLQCVRVWRPEDWPEIEATL